MQSRGKLARAAFVAPMLVAAGVATMVSCRDVLTSSDDQRLAASDITIPPGISAAMVRARAQLHARNKVDWVGLAHNRAIDDFRKEMRKPGRLSGPLCDYVTDFATRVDRLPVAKRGREAEIHREAIRRRLSHDLCRKDNAISRMKPTSYWAVPVSQDAGFSAQGAQLLSEILSAIDNASSSYSLAELLRPILDASANLDNGESEVVAASVSVAQNSSEYWEVEGPAFEQEVINEYGACADSFEAQSGSFDGVVDYCLNGESLQTNHPTLLSLNIFQSVTLTGKSVVSRECDAVQGLWRRWQAVIKADAEAGSQGGLAAFLSRKVPTVQGALAAAVARSIYDYIVHAFELRSCVMKNGSPTS